MPGFQILSQEAIEGELTSIMRRWDGSHEEQEKFRSWGWVVASVCDTYATENLNACADLLHDETAALHRVIAERLLHVNSISSELVSKRAFLKFLEAQLHHPPGPTRAAA
jgi:hypothetical protein